MTQSAGGHKSCRPPCVIQYLCLKVSGHICIKTKRSLQHILYAIRFPNMLNEKPYIAERKYCNAPSGSHQPPKRGNMKQLRCWFLGASQHLGRPRVVVLPTSFCTPGGCGVKVLHNRGFHVSVHITSSLRTGIF